TDSTASRNSRSIYGTANKKNRGEDWRGVFSAERRRDLCLSSRWGFGVDTDREAEVPRHSDAESARTSPREQQFSTYSPKCVGQCRSCAKDERSQQPKMADYAE